MRNAIERTDTAVMLILALTADSHAESQPKYRAKAYITKPTHAVTVDRPTAPTLAREEPVEQSGIPLSPDLASVLTAACEVEGVPLDIALGVMDVETGGTFDPTAVNPVSGCYGLMQLNPVYFPSGLTPSENIQAGIGYLGELLARYDTTDAALTAYHDGHDTGRRGYAIAVLEAAKRWEVTI